MHLPGLVINVYDQPVAWQCRIAKTRATTGIFVAFFLRRVDHSGGVGSFWRFFSGKNYAFLDAPLSGVILNAEFWHADGKSLHK